MPDYFGTYPNVNCYEYLDFFARAYGLAGTERKQALARTMGFTKLDGLARKPIEGLSKGMKQRLCLGRAMIHDPSVLILDEPAAGLDPRARIQLREMIRELAAEGKTLLISSHILTELAEICDQVGIIEQGQLLAMGSVDDIQKEQRGQSEVRMRVLRDVEQAANYLGQRDDVDNLRTDGELLFFTHKGDREMHVQILKDLVDQNFAIAEFASHEKSLEDVFMQITAGIVQ